MTDRHTAQAMDRAAELLRIAAEYIRQYCPEEMIHYDEADCGGDCLADDCENAAHDLELTPALQR